MQLAENTVSGWQSVVGDLTAKMQTARDRVEQLRSEKKTLALEAALGGAEAGRKLGKINSTLTTAAFELDDIEQAILQAEAEKRKAEQGEADEAEQARQQKLSTLATETMQHAAEFSRATAQAVKAGRSLRESIRAMLALATAGEQRGPSMLLGTECFERAGQLAGLRDFLSFPPYRGPREHVVPLEDEAAVHLSRWLPKTEAQEEMNGDQRHEE